MRRAPLRELELEVVKAAVDAGYTHVTAYVPDEGDPPFIYLGGNTNTPGSSWNHRGQTLEATVTLTAVAAVTGGEEWADAYGTLVDEMDDAYASKKFLNSWVCTTLNIYPGTTGVGGATQISAIVVLTFSAAATC